MLECNVVEALKSTDYTLKQYPWDFTVVFQDIYPNDLRPCPHLRIWRLRAPVILHLVRIGKIGPSVSGYNLKYIDRDKTKASVEQYYRTDRKTQKGPYSVPYRRLLNPSRNKMELVKERRQKEMWQREISSSGAAAGRCGSKCGRDGAPCPKEKPAKCPGAGRKGSGPGAGHSAPVCPGAGGGPCGRAEESYCTPPPPPPPPPCCPRRAPARAAPPPPESPCPPPHQCPSTAPPGPACPPWSRRLRPSPHPIPPPLPCCPKRGYSTPHFTRLHK
ncbi:hypothetical protein AAG570_000119 [Ranatra chinensis]|uniref:Uncharacterized protein n=1 Tax=Ranatra chinensis TaxID=642074 RepID=A0ABD0Z6L2_9HEMI